MAPQKPLIYLAPRAGFEPATYRLTAGCSTAELPGNMRSSRMSSAYNKRIKALQSELKAKAAASRDPAGLASRSCAAAKAGGHARN